MKQKAITEEINNYQFFIEDQKGSLKSKGSNVFFALDILSKKNKLDYKAKITSAYHIISKTVKVDITAILLNI